MKIAVIGPVFLDSFAKNICVTLEAMGHSVWNHPGTRVRHNQGRWRAAFAAYAPKLIPALEARFLQQLYQGISDFAPHVVLVTHDFFDEATVEIIRRRAKAPIVCWFTDAITNLGNGRLFATHYNRFYLKEPLLVEVFREKLGIQAEYMPEACNPTWHTPHQLTTAQLEQYGCDVATQGTLHHYRAAFYRAFAETDIRVKIWGSNASPGVLPAGRAMLTGRYIGEHEKAIALRAARIIVNNMNYGEIRGVNQTTFEAAGSGAFLLCDEKATMPALFKVDDEVVTFRSRAEMMDKVRYYLSAAGEAERLAIRERGWRRAHAEHTYTHRLTAILAGAA